ncbi:MAG: hypothetical protein C5B49_07910 [Bdellovibrio sp.]|nr:MAG: hypothetical protein C5B49_07910 [Bdellovibrio sp.]
MQQSKHSPGFKNSLVPVLALVFLSPAFLSCGYVGPSNPGAYTSSTSSSSGSSGYSNPPTFSEINSQIIQPNCLVCHSSGTYTFTTYDTLIAGGVVKSGSPSTSTLYLDVSSGKMPQGGTPLSTTDVNAIDNWISAGALR